jgi:hypothetical protein
MEVNFPVIALEGLWWVENGKHHEIYLRNPLRADPAKIKTILRHPVQKA